MKRTYNTTAIDSTVALPGSATVWRSACRAALSASVFVAISAGALRAQAADADADADAAPSAPVSEAASKSESEAASKPESEAAPKPENEAASKHRGGVFVDPLGFLIFGPTVGLEYGFERFSLLAYGRWLNAGLLAKSLFLNENERFSFSYGVGLKGRYYFNPGLVGPHLGVAVELLKTRVEDDSNRIAINNTIIVPVAEAGYRFGLGHFFINPSAGVGYAIQAAQSVENINGGSQAGSFVAADVSTIYGSLSLDMGLFF